MQDGLCLGFHHSPQCFAQYDRVGFHLCESFRIGVASSLVKFPIGLLTFLALNTYRINAGGKCMETNVHSSARACIWRSTSALLPWNRP